MGAAESISGDIELVIVNDGSPDDSLDLALALQRVDPRVVIVDLARNFGHHKAMMTGLAHVTGDLVFLIDSDLEEQPGDLALFYERFSRGDCDVAYGVQKARRGGWFERVSGELFFWLVGALSDRPIPRNIMTARLMTREYVLALVQHQDREFQISDLWVSTGFRQVPLPVVKLSLSPTSYSVRRRLAMAIKHIATTSTKLLFIILYGGIAVFGISTVMILYYTGRYFTSGIGVDGFTSLIVSIWFLGGLITLILGVISLYIATILSETKRRPYTVVRHVHRVHEAAARPNAIRVSGPTQPSETAVSYTHLTLPTKRIV